MRFVLLAVTLLIPAFSEAAIVVSEVAWMGSTASANHEWIELQNTSSGDVDVTGWTVSDGMNLTIPLTGTIPGNAYAVLERTGDVSAPGTAFLIYTGALVNTGATLRITRSDGGLEDQVPGGENWQNIGGDNVTKETAQYTTAGWVTGTPTPGAANSGTPRDEEDDDNEEDTDTSDDEDDTETETNTTPKNNVKKGSSGDTVRLVLRDVSLQLEVTSQSVGYVNQEISFLVTPSGIGDVLVDSLQYDWNFGDGSTAHTKESKHSFRYPGKYVVTVYGGFKRQEQVARHEITILPVSLSLSTNKAGDVQVNNDSPYEIDVSGYQVKGKRTFVFPKYSVILPKQTVTLPKGKVEGSYVQLKDTAGAVVTSGFALAKATIQEAAPAAGVTRIEPVSANPAVTNKEVWLSPLLSNVQDALSVTTATASSVIPSTVAPRLAASAASSTTPISAAVWPYVGLIIVILLGLVGTARKATRNQND